MFLQVFPGYPELPYRKACVPAGCQEASPRALRDGRKHQNIAVPPSFLVVRQLGQRGEAGPDADKPGFKGVRPRHLVG